MAQHAPADVGQLQKTPITLGVVLALNACVAAFFAVIAVYALGQVHDTEKSVASFAENLGKVEGKIETTKERVDLMRTEVENLAQRLNTPREASRAFQMSPVSSVSPR